MNKNFLKMMATGLACVALCGTACAARPDGCLRYAPAVRGGNGGRAPQKAPARQTAPAHNGGNGRAHNTAPAPHGAPAARHTPAPAPRHHEPPPPAHHNGHHDHGDCHEATGWVALGAAVLGGLVGGLVGACN